MKENTKIIHSIPVDELTGAISVPIYQTSTFVKEAPRVNKGFIYSRTNNPTRLVLENLITTLEYGSNGCAFASGLAADLEDKEDLITDLEQAFRLYKLSIKS